jgi:hypothetical protein
LRFCNRFWKFVDLFGPPVFLFIGGVLCGIGWRMKLLATSLGGSDGLDPIQDVNALAPRVADSEALVLIRVTDDKHGVMIVIQDGFHGVRSAVSEMRNPVGLDPGVSSGGFPLWRGRQKPSIIVHRNAREALCQTDDACSGETFVQSFRGSAAAGRESGMHNRRSGSMDRARLRFATALRNDALDAGIEMRCPAGSLSVRRKAMVVRRRHVNIKFACDGCRLAQCDRLFGHVSGTSVLQRPNRGRCANI